MHLDLRQLVQDVGDVGQLWPVELQVLARGEVAVAAVVDPGDVRELAHLARGQRAVGHGDAQHVGVQLQIDAVHEAQRLELVLRQLAGDAAVHLVAELRHPLAHELRIELVVAVHLTRPRRLTPSPRLPGSGLGHDGERASGETHSPERHREWWGRRRERARDSGSARCVRPLRGSRRDRAPPRDCARSRRRRDPPGPAPHRVKGQRRASSMVSLQAPSKSRNMTAPSPRRLAVRMERWGAFLLTGKPPHRWVLARGAARVEPGVDGR